MNFLSSALLLLALWPGLPQTEWVDSTSDGSGYVISGGFVASSTYERDRYEAATCANCYWRINPICETWDDENHGWCPYMVSRCESGTQIAEVFRANSLNRPSPASSLWRRTGYTCLGPAGPLATGEVLDLILGSKYLKVPPLEYTTQPPKKSLVNLPLTVQFTSAVVIPDRQIQVAGIQVTVRAAANRDIRCTNLTSCRNLTAKSLIFLNPGQQTFRVQSRWYGTFDALGLRGVPLDESAIVQTIYEEIPIFEIHRRLTN